MNADRFWDVSGETQKASEIKNFKGGKAHDRGSMPSIFVCAMKSGVEMSPGRLVSVTLNVVLSH